MSGIEGRSALVTGGGSGIGLGTATLLAADGAHVTICGRTEDKLIAAVEEISAAARHQCGPAFDSRHRGSFRRAQWACGPTA